MKLERVPRHVILYALSLLCVGVALTFFDVRIGFLAVGLMVWFDLFVSSALGQVRDIFLVRAFPAHKKGVKQK